MKEELLKKAASILAALVLLALIIFVVVKWGGGSQESEPVSILQTPLTSFQQQQLGEVVQPFIEGAIPAGSALYTKGIYSSVEETRRNPAAYNIGWIYEIPGVSAEGAAAALYAKAKEGGWEARNVNSSGQPLGIGALCDYRSGPAGLAMFTTGAEVCAVNVKAGSPSSPELVFMFTDESVRYALNPENLSASPIKDFPYSLRPMTGSTVMVVVTKLPFE